MENQLTNQTNKSLQNPAVDSLERALVLSRNILTNPKSLAITEMNLTITETIGKQVIRSVFKNDVESALGIITIIVTRFLNSFGFSTKHNEEQIDIISIDTLEHFSFESLEDIILFYKMARSGKFGATNRGVDSNLIFGDWLPKYLEIKSLEREKIITKKQNDYKSQPKISVEEVYQTYRKNLIRNVKNSAMDYINDFTKNMDRQMLEDTITSWSKDPELKNQVHLLKIKRLEIKK
jgi:hypothetical protein